jgi:hypothetical protein
MLIIACTLSACFLNGVCVFLTIPFILALSGSEAWAGFLRDTLGSNH